jgi:hypothetical protein
MTALTILRTILLDATAVSAIVGERVFAVMRPQDSSLPAILISSVYEEQDSVLAGHRSGFTNRMEVQCLAASIADADALAEVVKTALEVVNLDVVTGSPPEVEAVVQYVAKEGTDIFDYTEEPAVYRRAMDFSMRWVK